MMHINIFFEFYYYFVIFGASHLNPFVFHLQQSKMTENKISDFTTVVGLVNGMIGGTILVLPILGLAAGYVNMFVISILVGFIIFYTTYIVIIHIGKSKSIKECILAHFNQDYKYVKIYSFILWFGTFTLSFVYFKLLVLQVEGLVGNYWTVAPLCAVILFIFVFAARIYGLGEQALALGIISIVLYLFFIAWALLSAPYGSHEIPAVGQVYPLISTLIFAYGVYPLIAQNIFKNPNSHNYKNIVIFVYICGIFIYLFIVFGGSYSIANRISYKAKAETIEDYFRQGDWQVMLIEFVYLIHLVSVIPSFIIVSKTRFYDFFQVQLKPHPYWHQILYIFITIFTSLVVYMTGINISTLIEIKGSTLGYVNAFVFPIAIHLKCVYIDKSSGFIEGEDAQIKQIKSNICQCDHKYSSRWTRYLQTGFLAILLLLGLVNMIGSLAGIIQRS